MAYSYATYTGTGAQTDWSFPFPYISEDDISVLVDDVSVTFTFITASSVRLTVAPAASAVVKIQRITSKTNAPVDFADGSNLLESDLDLLTLWALYTSQESDDNAGTAADFLTATQAAEAAATAAAASAAASALTVTAVAAVVPVGTTVVLNVPATYATIALALEAIAYWAIAGTVQIQVADGTYTLAAGIVANHPHGHNIQIIGNQTTPANCVLMGTNPPTFDAFTVSNGNKLGLLDGFKFNLTSKAVLANNYTAILAVNGASIRCGTKILVNNWYYGIAARVGSTVYCRSAAVSNAGDVGIWSFCGSSVDAQSASSTGAVDAVNGYGYGFQAEYGSSLDCSSGSASGCQIAGIAALSGSNVRALSATSSTNVGSGFLARDGGTIEAHSGIAQTNTRYGIESIADGHVYYSSFTASGNTIANYAPKAYLDNTTATGARLVADDGPLRLDNSGVAATYFNTSNGVQFEVRDGGATGTSRAYASSGNSTTSDQPTIGVDGTATDISLRYQTKGTGSHFFRSSGGLQFGIFDAASAVNYLEATGAATGNRPRFQAFGTDTNISIGITPKGTGALVIAGVQACANDAAASAAGVPVNGIYRIGNALQLRLV